ncbi:HK97 family phage prohead protease [Sphingobium agri]|uniref:HK97 family phage prohead protease n=1 Tax=Sphingobium agri TaxID=2933566 RepID=A0ABT0DXC0_9SPHN|nr:HK97 family phage prohead protease [Sphingobium agri]MCK0531765.1 HK97 family phage prohead protease [Sphingobium agri]
MLLTKNCGVPLDMKAVGENGTIEGYGSIFGNIDSYGEIVEPGAFTQSLFDAKRKGSSVKMLWQHNPDEPIGIWDDIAEDSKGLYVKGRLLIDASPRAKEAHGLLMGGALDGLSIGYRTLDADPHPTKPGIISLKKLLLREVSIVTFAANERARVEAVKSALLSGGLPALSTFEDFLREAGFSKTQATAIASKGLAPLLRSESGSDPDAVKALRAAVDGFLQSAE